MLEDDDEGWVDGEEAGPELGAAETLANVDGELAKGTGDGSDF